MYGLFRIDFDVVVWQRQVNLSDEERCETLHIAALWCLLDPRALTSTVRSRHGQFLPRYAFAPLLGGKGLGT